MAYRLKLPQTPTWQCKHDVFNEKLLKPFIKASFDIQSDDPPAPPDLVEEKERLKPSWIVAKRDDISSIWSNGKVTLIWKTPGNHVETYAMPKKKWKTFTNNTQTNWNPLPLTEESLFLQTAQFLIPLNPCRIHNAIMGTMILKGVMLWFQALAPK